jgi:DNA adenine methylase
MESALVQMTYDGGKNANGVIHAIGRQIPPHRVRVEAFAGSAPLSRLVKLPDLNVIIDADRGACAAAASNPALVATTIVNGCALRWLRGAFPVQLAFDGGHRPPLQVKIEGRKFAARDVLVYLDPPYLLSTRTYQRDLYKHELKTEEEHAALLELLLGLPCLVMLSGYRSALYDSMLAEWRRVDFPAWDRQRRERTESLWCNFPEPVRLHDSRFWGKTFRDRWAFTKVKRRMRARVARMDTAKRWALFEELEEALGILTPETALRTNAPETALSPGRENLGESGHIVRREKSAVGSESSAPALPFTFDGGGGKALESSAVGTESGS